MSFLLPLFSSLLPAVINEVIGDKGGRRSPRKGQVRKTARRAYQKPRRRRKRRLPPRDKKGRFRRKRRRK